MGMHGPVCFKRVTPYGTGEANPVSCTCATQQGRITALLLDLRNDYEQLPSSTPPCLCSALSQEPNPPP